MKRIVFLVLCVTGAQGSYYKIRKSADFFELIQPDVTDPTHLVMVMFFKYPSKPVCSFGPNKCSQEQKVVCAPAKQSRRNRRTRKHQQSSCQSIPTIGDLRKKNNETRRTLNTQLSVVKKVASAIPQVDVVAFDTTTAVNCPVDFGDIAENPFFILYKEGQPIGGQPKTTPFLSVNAERGEIACEQDLINFIKQHFNEDIQKMIRQANKDLRRRAEIYASRPIVYSGIYPYFWGGPWQPWPWFY